MRFQDLTGQTFGSLTVLERGSNKSGRVCWKCLCTCGRTKEILANNLKSGISTTCGNCKEIVIEPSQRFGRLTVVEKVSTRNIPSWKCICDCGNETIVSEINLVSGNTKSCGCVRKESAKKNSQKKTLLDGTCIEFLENRKSRYDNKSGFRGVFITPKGNYRVTIGFQGKRYSVGTYPSYEEAVQARLEAEHALHDGFIELYRNWENHSEEWKESNPFTYQVTRDSNGYFYVE